MYLLLYSLSAQEIIIPPFSLPYGWLIVRMKIWLSQSEVISGYFFHKGIQTVPYQGEGDTGYAWQVQVHIDPAIRVRL